MFCICVGGSIQLVPEDSFETSQNLDQLVGNTLNFSNKCFVAEPLAMCWERFSTMTKTIKFREGGPLVVYLEYPHFPHMSDSKVTPELT